MKAIIIEDEKLAANRLEKMIIEIDPSIIISAKLESIKDSVKWFTVNKCDLIFCDIQLSDGNSFNIFEQIEIDTPIIFTTAYDQYAIKAFKLNSIDYLLKPIKRSELLDSIKKYKSIKSSSMIDYEEILYAIKNKEAEYKKRFLIQYGSKIKKIEIEQIAFFYAMEKSVFAVTFENNTYPIDYTLDKLEEVIDPKKFFRINRKILLNLEAIKEMIPYSRSRIMIKTNPSPPSEIEALVSVERAGDFKKWLDS
ncbi:MAG: LytTR family DNA-binding domain-containing protein [Melioribacteraceae bacterium]|nr:LytTR family DNA-binding domain-containing protein [Melioribacteraceae bacterium]